MGILSFEKQSNYLIYPEMQAFDFSAEKCKILKINSEDNSNSLFLSGIKLEADLQFRYLGQIFSIIRVTILHCVKTGPKRQQAPATKLFHYAKSPFWETLKFLL